MADEQPVTRPYGPAVPPSGPAEPSTGGHSVDAAATQAIPAVASPPRVGRFAIIQTLGRGGMGVVYLARDARDKREVALKVIPAGPDADPTDLARFRTEAEAVARLDHPNIVKLYEVGEDEKVAYLAMEYVDGGSLHRRVQQKGPLSPVEAARMLEQIARATHYAHTNGVVHRDLKPSNILLAKNEGERMKDEGKATLPSSFIPHPSSMVPKLADFGLAKQLDKSLRLTQTGIAVGTPHYMAPEQARGQADQIGPSVDVHALGAILYELIVGHPPFGGGSPMETMQQVVEKRPVPPSQLRDGIPPDLEAICLKCLEKSPAKRYRTAEALADDLGAFLSNLQPRGKDDPSIVIEATRRSKRWLIPAIGGGLLLLGLVAAAVWHLTSRAHRDETATAARAERRARLEAAIAKCERGHVSAGLEQMRALEAGTAADGLPVRELIAAWEGRVLKRDGSPPYLMADVLAISPRGELVAAANVGTVQVWHAANGSPHPNGNWSIEGGVSALGWSEDGVSLVIATTGGDVFVASVATGERSSVPLVRRPDQTILAVAFAFPGVRLVYGGTVLHQELAPALRPRRPGDVNRFDLTGGPFVAAAIAPGSANVAVVLGSGSVRVFDAADGRWHDLPPDGHATTVAYSADGNVLAVATRAGMVRLWDAIARIPLTESAALDKPADAIAVRLMDTDYTVAVGRKDGLGALLTCGRPFVAPPIRLTDRPGKEVLGVAFGQGGESVYVTSPSGISRWRVSDAKRYGPMRDYSSVDHYGEPEKHQARFSAGTVQGDRDTLLVGGSGGRLFAIDADDGKTMRAARAIPDTTDVTAVAVGRQGQTASASRKGAQSIARHWAGPMDADPAALELPCEINQEAYLPDGSAMVLACSDGAVRVWEPIAGRVRLEVECGSPVLAVAVNEDGSRVLAGCADGTARLWDLAERKEFVVVRHAAEVRAVAFHDADLLTASADGTARLWHAGTGLPLGPPLAHPDAINALAVRGDMVATGGRDRYVRVWRLP